MEDTNVHWTDSESSPEDGRIRILHVEDDPDFADLVAELLELEAEEFEVQTDHSADDGIERLSATDIDCIVSDYDMPGKNGLEFFGSIQEENSDVPFILYTGKGSEEIASDAISLGITDYLQKGGSTDQYTVLANRIRNAVDQYRSRREADFTRERFQVLVEESNDAILVVAPDGTFRYATPAVEHIFGWKPSDVIGVSGFERIHTDDVDGVREEFGKLVEDPDRRSHVEFRYLNEDGSWTWVETWGRNLLEKDVIQGIVVYVRDVDGRIENERELAQREKMFRAVFEEAIDAMVISDDDGTYVDANPAACELFGLEKVELIGRSNREFAPEDYDLEGAWREFQHAGRERGLFPLVRPDGDRRTVEFGATRGIRPNKHLFILRDVTERESKTAN